LRTVSANANTIRLFKWHDLQPQAAKPILCLPGNRAKNAEAETLRGYTNRPMT
jgi:hypothetical protein